MNPVSAGYQVPLGFSTPAGSRFGDFVPGANAEALSQLQALAAGRESAAVYLWGPPESGKTHLLYAICAEVAAWGRPVYVPLREARSLSPLVLEGLESADLACIDDVDEIGQHADWERGLFHLYNRLRDAGKPLVISGRHRPDLAPVPLADLRSRLAGSLVFRLEPPDEAAKIAALQRRARLRGLEIPESVANYLLRRCPRDLGSLLKLMDRLDEASLSAQRRLTVPFVRAFLDNNNFAATAG
jgi:DnaA family protein